MITATEKDTTTTLFLSSHRAGLAFLNPTIKPPSSFVSTSLNQPAKQHTTPPISRSPLRLKTTFFVIPSSVLHRHAGCRLLAPDPPHPTSPRPPAGWLRPVRGETAPVGMEMGKGRDGKGGTQPAPAHLECVAFCRHSGEDGKGCCCCVLHACVCVRTEGLEGEGEGGWMHALMHACSVWGRKVGGRCFVLCLRKIDRLSKYGVSTREGKIACSDIHSSMSLTLDHVLVLTHMR